jgi:hypothetical protein
VLEGTEWWVLSRQIDRTDGADLPPPVPVAALVPDDPTLSASALTAHLLAE